MASDMQTFRALAGEQKIPFAGSDDGVQNHGSQNNVNETGTIPALFRIDRHLHTLYLFTASDLAAVLGPQTLFAVSSSLSGHLATNGVAPPSPSALLSRLPHAVVWIWLDLLVLDTANQRLPGSVAEDALNKPWRPIPERRISSSGTRLLLIVSIVATYAASAAWLGGVGETLALFVLNWLYNDLDLSSGHWLWRNVLNALGITTIGAGAVRVACGPGFAVDEAAFRRWWLLCAGVVLSTIQAQDLSDQEGDAARGRATVPLVFGDGVARWSLAVAVLAWSVIMPVSVGMSWPESWSGFAVPVLLGSLVAVRVLVLRDVRSDKVTFKAWAAWNMCLYALPLARSRGWDGV